MTAISIVNPYAPQPAGSLQNDGVATVQLATPARDANASNDAGLASDQSGQGAGNGTGTGGAQLNAMLKKSRDGMEVQLPTSESVVEAQSDNGPAEEFLARQAQLKFQAEAAENARAEERAIQRAEDAKNAAAKAIQPELVMPNPLPTAPILKGDSE